MIFTLNLSTLSPPQLRLWQELDATPEHFTLYGGTALALRHGHRASVHFDFFSKLAAGQIIYRYNINLMITWTALAIFKFMNIEKRKLGKTGIDVTIFGLGGEGVLRTFGYERESYQLINKTIDLGVNYLESARAYSGSESYYGKALKERRKEIFLTSKSHARDKSGALMHLQETLRNMKTDHLDLWQVHDVRTQDEIDEIFGPKGALEAMVEARDKGLVRFIGITGHQDPFIIKRCIELFDFDTVLLPVNPAEPHHKSFLQDVIPVANKKGMGIIGMKIFFRGLASRLPGFTTMEPFFRFALSQPITNTVIGCDNIQQLEENVSFASSFKPMSEKEVQDLIGSVAPYAAQLMYYKS